MTIFNYLWVQCLFWLLATLAKKTKEKHIDAVINKIINK